MTTSTISATGSTPLNIVIKEMAIFFVYYGFQRVGRNLLGSSSTFPHLMSAGLSSLTQTGVRLLSEPVSQDSNMKKYIIKVLPFSIQGAANLFFRQSWSSTFTSSVMLLGCKTLAHHGTTALCDKIDNVCNPSPLPNGAPPPPPSTPQKASPKLSIPPEQQACHPAIPCEQQAFHPVNTLSELTTYRLLKFNEVSQFKLTEKFIPQVSAHTTLIWNLRSYYNALLRCKPAYTVDENKLRNLLYMPQENKYIDDMLKQTDCTWGIQENNLWPKMDRCVILKAMVKHFVENQEVDMHNSLMKGEIRVKTDKETKLHLFNSHKKTDKETKTHLFNTLLKQSEVREPYWIMTPLVITNVEFKCKGIDKAKAIADLDMLIFPSKLHERPLGLLWIFDVIPVLDCLYQRAPLLFLRLSSIYPTLNLLCAPYMRVGNDVYYPVVTVVLKDSNGRLSGSCSLHSFESLLQTNPLSATGGRRLIPQQSNG